MTVIEEALYEIVSRRNLVLLGESGSGKSEIALGLAEALAKDGEDVDFFDLDQSKPLLRSRDAAGRMEAAGVQFFYEEQFLDAPVIRGGIERSLMDHRRYTILDIGGFDIGARTIGRFSRILSDDSSRILYVLNAYRPWTKTTGTIEDTIAGISLATRLKEFHMIANPNLGPGTSADEFMAGMKRTLELMPAGFSLDGAFAENDIYKEVKERLSMETDRVLNNIPVMPLELKLACEWL